MSEEASTNSDDKCRSCKGALNPGAMYCLHCNSYQNWRRHINLSSSVLALLVALVSVISATAPGLINSLRQQYSRVDLSVLDCNSTNFVLLAVNQGNRRAVIASVNINMERVGEYPFAAADGDRVLAAEEVKELSLSAIRQYELEYLLRHAFWDGENNERIDRADTSKAHFEIDVIEYDGKKNTYKIPIPQNLFQRFLGNVFPGRTHPGEPIPFEPYETD